VNGDGNCLFYALSLALYGTADKWRDLKTQIKEELVAHKALLLKDNPF